MGVTVLIQAAGEPNRGWWEMAVRKQMVLIGGEPLVVRTQRQCMELGYQPIIVSNHPEILAVAERAFVPKIHGWWLETTLSTRDLWQGLVIMLFGDVVWSDRMLALTLEQRKSPLFILGSGGIHAWMFHEKDTDMIAGTISALLEEGRRNQSQLFVRLGGKGSSVHFHLPADGGFTIDFDYSAEYLKWQKEHGAS